MVVTEKILIGILEISSARARKWCDPLDYACRHYAITSAEQLAAFLAQVGHESGRLRYVREIWGPMPWQMRYEGRRDLGNVQPGDGKRFMGRGLIQITGRSNYQHCADALNIELIDQPELLEEPVNAALSAAWFWHAHGLNDLADQRDIKGITRIINGGYNGLADRTALHTRALIILGCNNATTNHPDITINDDALI